jgi:hypothetical protein
MSTIEKQVRSCYGIPLSEEIEYSLQSLVFFFRHD